jgi:hypothetical protein
MDGEVVHRGTVGVKPVLPAEQEGVPLEALPTELRRQILAHIRQMKEQPAAGQLSGPEVKEVIEHGKAEEQ